MKDYEKNITRKEIEALRAVINQVEAISEYGYHLSDESLDIVRKSMITVQERVIHLSKRMLDE